MSLTFPQILALFGLGTAGSAGSSAASAGRSRSAQRRQQKYTERNMDKQHGIARSMRQTAFQDTTASMKAAGLNPALMYGSGGASVGGGTAGGAPAGASAVSADINDPSSAVAAAVSTAREAKVANANIKYMTKQTDLLNAKQKTEYINQINALFNRQSLAARITGDMKKSFHTQKLIKELMDGIVKDIKSHK